MSENTCPHCRRKQRSEEEKRALLNRLARVEGQLKGIRRMVQEDAYCPDILTQSSAAASALNAFSRELLAAHISTCAADDIRLGKEGAVEELLQTLQRFMK